MANPFHDGTGRFCTAGEMLNAIDTAAKNGQHETYFQLRKDYEEIINQKQAQQDVKKIKTINVEDVINQAPKDFTDAESTIELYSDIKVFLDDPEDKSGIFKPLLINPNTPEDIKNEILTKSTLETRKGIVELIEATPYDGANEDYKKILATLPPERSNIINAMKSKVLTLNDKQELAPKYEGGYAVFALTNPRFYNRYDTEIKLREETMKLKNSSPQLQHNALRALGKGKDTESHELLISKINDSTHIAAVQEMMKNKHVKPATMNKLFQRLADNNIQNWAPAVNSLDNVQKRYRTWANNYSIQQVLEGRPNVASLNDTQRVTLEKLALEKSKRNLTVSENDQYVTLLSKKDATDENFAKLKAQRNNYDNFDKNNTDNLDELNVRIKYAEAQRLANVLYTFNKNKY